MHEPIVGVQIDVEDALPFFVIQMINRGECTEQARVGDQAVQLAPTRGNLLSQGGWHHWVTDICRHDGRGAAQRLNSVINSL